MKKIFTLLFLLATLISYSQSTTIVISQVYGGGGGATATYNADYVELHNLSATAQDISGYKIMYGSSAGNLASTAANAFTFPATGSIIPAGGYLLVATIAGTGLASLPVTADQTFTLTLSATNGKIAFGTAAMVTNTLYSAQPAGSVIDLVGYGTSADFETAAVPVLSATTAAIRNNNGCAETNNNLLDFTVGAPAPRNSASAAVTCTGGPSGPTVVAGSVTNFGSVLVSTSSTSQTFNVTGSNLTGFPGVITITSPSTDFEVSNNNTTWGASTTLAYSTATLSATPVYVRFTPQTVGLKTGNVTVTGGGIASAVNVAVVGNGTSTTPQVGTLVISQLFGAGGNPGAFYNADYVEIHNKSNTTQSLSGYSIQYSSATATGTWSGKSLLPVATIPAGAYYLIQMSSASTINGVALPTPDYNASPTISMSQTNGRVALVSDTVTLSGCPATANIIDLVGYGTSVCYEAVALPALDTLHAGFRNNNGCDDTNNNLADFTLNAPAPRNSASPIATCVSGPATPVITAGSVTNFGNVIILTTSASQTFNISGADLTGAPGVITITAPNANFQVSSDGGVTWSSSVTIPYTSATLSSTAIMVHFTPQAAGAQSGNITISGGGASVTVAVSGNCVLAATPSITTGTLTAFGAICLNTTAGPNSFTITGADLTVADITVGPLAGYTFSTTSGGTFTTSLTLTHAAGAVSQIVYVNFTPTSAISYNGNIVVAGAGVTPSVNVAASGSGANSAPSVTTGASSAITLNSATLAGSIPSSGCSAVSVYGIEYSLVNGFANGSGTQVVSTNLSGTGFTSNLSGLTASTNYYYKAYATNTGGTTYGVQSTFRTAAPPAASLSATSLLGFGDVCVNSMAGPNSFDISGSNLTNANILVGPLNGYSFSTVSGGPYSTTLTITQPGGTFTQTIYVSFMPNALGAFNNNIPVAGAGLTAAINVAVTGNGTISTAVILSADSTSITANSAVLHGTIADAGCTSITEYGVEYSGFNGFANGTGTQVTANNLVNNNFSSQLTGLVQNTAYYYKAYAKNTGGTAYGEQKLFITSAIATGLTIYSQPIVRGTNVHYTVSGMKPGHYSTKIFNSVGQLVYQKEMILQVNFIDDNFILPAKLPIGLYTLQIFSPSFKIQKSMMVQ